MKYKPVSVENFFDKKESENEDSFAHKLVGRYECFALSDGAGGAGIFCGEWADMLTANQPDIPFTSLEEGREWFLELSRRFFHVRQSELENDEFVRERFYKEGSWATLLFCWIDSQDKTLYYTAIGDTAMFYFCRQADGQVIKAIKPLDKLKNLNESPEMLNWSRELNIDLTPKSLRWNVGDILILCTDSIARRLIYQLIVIDPSTVQNCLNDNLFRFIDRDLLETVTLNTHIKRSADLLKYLDKLLGLNKGDFKASIRKLVESNELEKDDYTIIKIDLE